MRCIQERSKAADSESSGKPEPPEDATDEYCTCDLYNWPEQSCPYAQEILEVDDDDYCTCCIYHYRECLY